MLVYFRLLCWSHATGLGAVFIQTTLSGFLLIWGLHGKLLTTLVYVESSEEFVACYSFICFFSIQRNQVLNTKLYLTFIQMGVGQASWSMQR